ncbi:hypothetical protein HYN78_17990 [Vibrio parahaemolyticus]|nr:hypothetical protein [Vibrio parahaemolyticus]MBM5197377.1 hypothetical protein [Vibrio parahaemolyticus]
MTFNNSLINFSRAGDIFHYRWAAKRCLKLLDFNTKLHKITIEGSLEPDKPGECVVDVAEYSMSGKGSIVEYFQLKHSTTQLDCPFTLSGLKDTIVGFSERFRAFSSKKSGLEHYVFTVITNRPIAKSFKTNIKKIANNQKADIRFTETIEKYTGLKGKLLTQFCSVIRLCDGEGNYDAQKYDIHKELSLITVSKEFDKTAKLLVSKITEKIEPGKSNVITINDVLEVFDITDIHDFFPAPPQLEAISEYIQREQEEEIIKSISSTRSHTLISANGGVGKSILCQNIARHFNEHSFAIVYDCFGNGGYRRTSQKRHRPHDSFVQVSNQLAKEGLCTALIPSRHEPDDYWMRAFLTRLNEACTALRERCENALLVLIFDAVDNAEMAAKSSGDSCFASLLIREHVPDNCRIVFASRPERTHLFDPPPTVNMIELQCFTDRETFLILSSRYKDVSIHDAKEFNRLTSGNPRVQANALSLNAPSISELLSSFSSNPMTVDDLIEKQLEKAIASLKDTFPKNDREQIDAICTGLATLPPFIPLNVLALVAEVSEDLVRSFITELGRPLWMTDSSVQFRDEPTEKWFQDTFIATTTQIRSFIERIKPLANIYSYVSEALPLMMLKAELFDELVELALSDDSLPTDRPFDARKIRLFRLQYAFKAALKERKYYEASKLALRAGEEIAGDERQIEILSKNCDLTTRFLSSERVQELAHRRVLGGAWEGSETVYSSSLLSSIGDCAGEARSYLRSARHWLHRYFDRRDESEESEDRFDEKLNELEIVELVTSTYNLFGECKAVDYLLSWSPQCCIFKVTETFIRRLIDLGDFDSISKMAIYGKKNPSFILAVTSELVRVGKSTPRECLTQCLNQIVKPTMRLEKPDDLYHSGYSSDAFLSFFEACTIEQLPAKNILRALNYYIGTPRLYSVADDYQHLGSRTVFMRSVSIKLALKKTFSTTVEEIIPSEWVSKEAPKRERNDLAKAKESLEKLLPWYLVASKIWAGQSINLEEEHILIASGSRNDSYGYYDRYHSIRYECSLQRFRNIIFYKGNKKKEVENFLNDFNDEKVSIRTNDKLSLLRVCCRQEELGALSDAFEVSCYEELQQFNTDEFPESYSEQYIALSRAVMSLSLKEASLYFNKAIEIASNFGEEAVVRWESIVSIAKRSCANKNNKPEMAHRFMRCAELIGETVAKEKYWDRNDAVNTCFMLSPQYAFSVASRWKDRQIGWSERQLVALANSALNSNQLTPDIVWSLSAFSWDYDYIEFVSNCIDQEVNPQKKQIMFDYLVQDLRARDVRGTDWKIVEKTASRNKLNNAELCNLTHLKILEKRSESGSLMSQRKEDTEEYDWNSIYGNFDLLKVQGLRSAFEKSATTNKYWESDRFWNGCYSKLSSRNVVEFLDVLKSAEFLDFYDIRNCLKFFPTEWKARPSVEQAWCHMMKCLAKRYPYRFTNIYERNYIPGDLDCSTSTLQAIQDGVLDGFSNSVDLESATALFGFANYCTSLISTNEAESLLDYGLKRFELHIDDDFADGCWSEYFASSKTVTESLAAYLFANLGSPENTERWRTVHAVIRLYKLGCRELIEILIDLMISDDVKEFVPPAFPFYEMHAKLYLLMALSVCSSDGVMFLQSRKKSFAVLAMQSNSNILIQLYSKEIARKIEEAFPGCYDEQTLNVLSRVGKSSLAPTKVEKYGYQISSPWHACGTLDTSLELWFDHDFDHYWFEPLGRVFGISSKEVADLAVDVVLGEWNMSFEEKYIDDPRKDLWSNRRNRKTWHSHGEYPEIDNYQFYISYHAMLTVASKLLVTMPVVQHSDFVEDSWSDWLERHLLCGTRDYLLANLRDPFPLERRGWVSEDKGENWLWEITSSDFLDMLYTESESGIWINIGADWNEYSDGYNERISISSAFIPKQLGDCFLRAITSFDNHMHETYLSNFCDNDMRVDSLNHQFKGKEWLTREEYVYGLDKNDPYAGDIDPRMFTPEDKVVERFDLRRCKYGKKWFMAGSSRASIINELWSDEKPLDHDTDYRAGIRSKASMEFLLAVCRELDIEIAIQVNMKRSLVGRYNNKSDDNYGYIPRYSKTFLLSGDGRIRDTRRSYSFREKATEES